MREASAGCRGGMTGLLPRASRIRRAQVLHPMAMELRSRRGRSARREAFSLSRASRHKRACGIRAGDDSMKTTAGWRRDRASGLRRDLRGRRSSPACPQGLLPARAGSRLRMAAACTAARDRRRVRAGRRNGAMRWPCSSAAAGIFRFDTFGDEEFWGGTLRLHEAIAGEALRWRRPRFEARRTRWSCRPEGRRAGASLPTALFQLKRGEVDLDDPATTLALLEARTPSWAWDTGSSTARASSSRSAFACACATRPSTTRCERDRPAPRRLA